MASFQKLENGKWQARVRKKGRSSTAVFIDKKDAKAWAEIKEREIDRSQSRRGTDEQAKMTFGGLCVEYEKLNGERKGWSKDANVLVNLPKKIKVMRVSDMAREVIQDWVDGQKGTLSPTTINKRLDLIRSIINWGKKQFGGLAGLDNVINNINRPKIITSQNERERVATSEELELIKKHASKSPFLADLIDLMVETAARRAELISIQFSQIDYINSVIKLKAEQTKTGRARKLLLSDKAVEILKRREEKASGSPFVFSSQFKPDQPVHPDSMTTTFTRLRKRVLEKEGIDIRDLRLHDLRHTAATNWKAAGLDVVEVMSLTGHTQFKSVKRYMNPTSEDVAAKMRRLTTQKRGNT